jgi:hypothetical protein
MSPCNQRLHSALPNYVLGFTSEIILIRAIREIRGKKGPLFPSFDLWEPFRDHISQRDHFSLGTIIVPGLGGQYIMRFLRGAGLAD